MTISWRPKRPGIALPSGLLGIGLLLFSGMTSPGCGTDGGVPREQYTTVDTTATRVVEVFNHGVGSGSVSQEVREDLRIGAIHDDVPAAFSSVIDFLVDSGLNVYVLDRLAQEIRVFDSSGQFTRAFGGVGAGPGELRRAVAMAWSPSGTIWVADVGNQRYTEFSVAGDLLRSARIRVTHYRVDPVLAAGDNGVLFDEYLDRTREPRLHLRILTVGTGEADYVPLTDTLEAEPFRLGRGTVSLPYGWRYIWRPDPIRGLVWSLRTDTYEVHARTITGDSLTRLGADVDRVKVTPDERERTIASLESMVQAGAPQERLDYSRIPDQRPAIENVDLDDRGRLWVRRRGKDGRLLADVYSHRGQFLETISFPEWSVWHVRPMRIVGDAVVTVVEDSLQVSHVVRGRFRPAPGPH